MVAAGTVGVFVRAWSRHERLSWKKDVPRFVLLLQVIRNLRVVCFHVAN